MAPRLIIAAAVVVLSASHHASSAGRAASLSPGISSACLGGAFFETCYAPSAVAIAQRRFPLAVNPSVAVRKATHLALTVVILSRTSRKGAPAVMYYGYGNVWPVLARNPLPAAHRPTYVLVTEIKGHVYPYRNIHLDLEVGRWHLRANFPHRNLSLSLYATVSQGAVRTIALSLLATHQGSSRVQTIVETIGPDLLGQAEERTR